MGQPAAQSPSSPAQPPSRPGSRPGSGRPAARPPSQPLARRGQPDGAGQMEPERGLLDSSRDLGQGFRADPGDVASRLGGHGRPGGWPTGRLDGWAGGWGGCGPRWLTGASIVANLVANLVAN